MNRIVKSYITEFLIGDIQDAWCCLTTTIALFVYFSVPWLHLIYYIKENKFANGYEPLLEELKQVACYILHISLETSLD